MLPRRAPLLDRADHRHPNFGDRVETYVVGAESRTGDGTGCDFLRPIDCAPPEDLLRPSSPLGRQIEQAVDLLVGARCQRRLRTQLDDLLRGRATPGALDELLDQPVLLPVDVTRPPGELSDQILGDGRKLPSFIAVRTAIPLLPLDAEQSGEPICQHSVVMLGHRNVRVEQRPPIQTSPSPILSRLDLVRDDDVGVELRIAEP